MDASLPTNPEAPSPAASGVAPPLTITVNGEDRVLSAALALSDFLAGAGLDLRKVAVERNEEIVPRSAYAATLLGPGDRLEIVHFIGGG